MFEKITKDLTDAMKSRDNFKLSVLRMLKSNLKNEEINKKGELTDEEVLTVIKKQVKMRKDSKEEYTNYNRLDLAEALEKEIEILSVYLPKELTKEEIESIIDELIIELKPEGIKEMGKIIKAVKDKCGVSADMQLVSSLVKEKLGNL